MDELILKCLQGEASKSEQQEVWGWLKDSKNYEYYCRIRDSWIATGMINRESLFDIDLKYQKIQKRIQPKTQSARILSINQWSKIWRVAAVFFLAFVMGSAMMYLGGNKMISLIRQQNYEIEAPMGAKINMTLADGSRVWLNAGSKLTYSGSYNKTDRNLSLVGEAYFEVEKNKQLPLFVEADGIKVKAVGTAFNVKAYPDEAEVEATLVEGIIDVSEGAQTLRLEPSQKASFIRSSAKLIRKSDTGSGDEEIERVKDSDIKTEDIILSKDVNTDLYTSWRGKKWIFQGENLADFTKKLERRYDVHIYIMNTKLNEYKISGSVQQQTLGQLLSAVRLTVPISYKIINDKVILSLDEQLEIKYKSLMK